MLEKLKQGIAWRLLPKRSRRAFEQLLSQVEFYHEELRSFQRDTGDDSLKSLEAYFKMRTAATTGPDIALHESELRESLSEDMDEPGWRRLAPTYYSGIEDLPVVRQDAVRASRYYALRDPLMHRAVWLVIRYVWGRGITGPRAKDEQVQAFVDAEIADDDNDLLFKSTGQWELAQTLIEDGEIFETAFVNTFGNGHTKFSYVLTDEIDDVITAPNNRRKPTYYKRTWTPQAYSFTSGAYTAKGPVTDYWPDWTAPEAKVDKMPRAYICECGEKSQGIVCPACGVRLTEAALTDTVDYTGVEHATVGDRITRCYMHQYKINSRNARGLPAFYSGIPYIKAYKGFIQDRIVLLIALATFAFKQNIKGNQKQITRIADQWGNTVFGRYGSEPTRRTDQERAPGGRVLLQNDAAQLEQMQVDTGASNAYMDGRITRQQVAAATDITEPDLTGDPSVGNLASMTAMNGPQLKGFEWWQQIFETIIRDSVTFAISQGVKYGAIDRHNADGTERDLSFEVDFPPIVEKDLPQYIAAVAQLISAQSLSGARYISPERIARYILQVFGEKDIDAALAELDFSKPLPQTTPGVDVPGAGFPDSAADQIEALRKKVEEALG